MATKKKLLQAAAGSAGGAALNVEDVFSIHLWDGAGGTQTIVNGVDLTQGGLVWAKQRNSTIKHVLSDSERGTTKVLSSNLTTAESTETNGFTSFNSDGFTFGSWAGLNNNGDTYASWTFRKAPKFFDIITYSGTGSNQTISHNLGSTPGMIVVKARNNSDDAWYVWHRSIPQFGSNAQYRSVVFWDSSSAYSNYSIQTAQPDDSNIYVGSTWSTSGYDYVMYVFAHNNNDGGFGPDGDQDIIKCGSYVGDGDTDRKIDIGFEAQYVFVKNVNQNESWIALDKMRGLPYKGNGGRLRINFNDAESEITRTGHWSNGFSVLNSDAECNQNNDTYIYVAIRNNMPAEPESGTEVYTIDGEGGDGVTPTYDSPNFTPDLAWKKPTNNGTNWMCHDRIRRGYAIKLNAGQAQSTSEDTEGDGSAYGRHWDYMDGWAEHGAVGNNIMAHMFKRAKGFLDIVRYTGAGTSIPINHQLGAVPKMVWCKRLDAASSWQVYHEHMDATAPEDYWMYLDGAATKQDSSLRWNDTAPTDTTFTVGTAGTGNTNNADYIAYVWGEVSGVSKFGTYTGNGTSQNIDCGFSSGARFVLIKALNVGYAWCVFTTHRGIVSGDDKFMTLETTAEVTNKDIIDPYASGFAVSGTDYLTNANNEDYIYWAIA